MLPVLLVLLALAPAEPKWDVVDGAERDTWHGASGAGGVDVSPDGRFVAFTRDGEGASGDLPRRDVWILDRDDDRLEHVSLDAAGRPLARAEQPSVSADGRFVAFTGFATGEGGAASFGDVFVRDLRDDVTTRLSRAADGGPASGTSRRPVLSDDGALCVFETWADDLLPGDHNGTADVVLCRRVGGALTWLSARPDGGAASGASYAPTLSADGRVVAFVSDAPDLLAERVAGTGVFVLDLHDGALQRIPLGGAASAGAETPFVDLALSGDGSRVAFVSRTADAATGAADGLERVFVYDRARAVLEVKSLTHDGRAADAPCFAPSLSADGRRLAFHSRAGNLVPGTTDGFDHVFVRDLVTGHVARWTRPALDAPQRGGDSVRPVLAGDGDTLVIVSDAAHLADGDENGVADVLVRDLRGS